MADPTVIPTLLRIDLEQPVSIPAPEGALKEKRKRKARNDRLLSEVTLEELQALYHLPMKEAASRLGIGRTSLKRCARDLGVPKWPYTRHKVNDLGQGTKGHAGAGAGKEAAVAASVKSINSFDFASLDEAQRCKLNERATELQKESDEMRSMYGFSVIDDEAIDALLLIIQPTSEGGSLDCLVSGDIYQYTTV